MAVSYTLLAAMIGRRFNVQCRTSGGNAYTAKTDGKYIINLPVLSDEALVPVLTGYAYHEIAHIRHTQFSALENVKDELVKQLTNIFEDVRVERRIMQDYPGMLVELKAVEKYAFADIDEEYEGAVGKMRYLLYRVRGLINPSSEPSLAELEQFVSRATQTTCTKDCLELARAAAALIDQQEEEQQSEGGQAQGDSDDDVPNCDISDLMQAKLLQGTGTSSKVQASVYKSSEVDNSVVSELGPMPPALAHRAQACASLLTNKLLALMQTYSMAQETAQLRGRINTKALHRLAVNNPHVFNRRVIKNTVDAHVMLLLDGSGSMDGVKAEQASMAGYAFKSALSQIRGVTCEEYAFFNLHVLPMDHGREYMRCPLGVTPLGSAYDALLCKTKPDKKNIIICVTDGQIDDPDMFESALNVSRMLGNIVTYGIGIFTNPPEALPKNKQITITDISELPNKLFGLAEELLA